MDTDNEMENVTVRSAKSKTTYEEELRLKELRVAIWENLRTVPDTDELLETLSGNQDTQVAEWYLLGDMIAFSKEGNRYRINHNHQLSMM